MAGRPGRSGGHNRISLEAHVLRGTFNPTRHPARIPTGPAWDPAPAQLEALGAAGRAFVARLQAAYTVAAIDGEFVLEAAVSVDRLAELRRGRAKASAKDRRALDYKELAWQKSLTACLLALRARLARTAAAAADPAPKWGGAL